MESDYLFEINSGKGGSSKGSFHWDKIGHLGNVGDRYPPGPLKEQKTSRKAQGPYKS
jgi:hypothetical protein